MKPDDNQDTVRRFFQELDQHNFAVIDQLIDAGFVDHTAPPGMPQGPAGVHMFYSGLYGAFPNLVNTIHDCFGQGGRVCVRKTSIGTHTGTPIFGVPANSAKLAIDIIDIFRLRDGKITEHWHGLDSAEMMRQLGGA
jgi:steroid delta-isomerase-like uncharacterized protein